MTAQTLTPATVDGITERFDPTACLDERVRHQALPVEPVDPGRYIEIQGPDRTLLIALTEGAMHVGRGLAAELRLDDVSVSRRHAIIVPRPGAHGSSTTAAPTARSSTGAGSSRPTCATAT